MRFLFTRNICEEYCTRFKKVLKQKAFLQKA
jgi:thioredoxin-related protein